MKKFISVLLVAYMLLCLCACGSDNVKSSKNSKSDDNELLSRIEQLEKQNASLEKRVEVIESIFDDRNSIEGGPKDGVGMIEEEKEEELLNDLLGAGEVQADDDYDVEESTDLASEYGYVLPDESVVVDLGDGSEFDYSEFFSE